MAANAWPFGQRQPYLVASHHVDERDGQVRNLPRGKAIWSEAWQAIVFWRDLPQHNVIREVGKKLDPPGGMGLETDILDWMIEVGVSHVMFRIKEIGVAYRATPGQILRRGWKWDKGQRPQRIMPLAEWHPTPTPLSIPEIPDSRVLVIGGPATDSRAYGVGTDGGTHGWYSDGSRPKASI